MRRDESENNTIKLVESNSLEENKIAHEESKRELDDKCPPQQ